MPYTLWASPIRRLDLIPPQSEPRESPALDIVLANLQDVAHVADATDGCLSMRDMPWAFPDDAQGYTWPAFCLSDDSFTGLLSCAGPAECFAWPRVSSDDWFPVDEQVAEPDFDLISLPKDIGLPCADLASVCDTQTDSQLGPIFDGFFDTYSPP